MSEIHIAGPMIDFVQRCSRCGEILTDYRDSAVPEGDPPPRGWMVDARIEVERYHGMVAFSITDARPTCDYIQDETRLQ